MAKCVEIKSNVVVNLTVPGTSLDASYRSLMEAAGYTLRVEEDSVSVEIGWNYNPETHTYTAP